MTDDDAPTPQVQPVPSYLRPRGESDDPSVYLVQEVSPEEHTLSRQVGLHNGAPVPWWMFAKAVLRLRDQGKWIGTADGLYRRGRRVAVAAVSALVLNLGALGSVVAHRIATSAAAEEHAAAQERLDQERRDSLRRELDYLERSIETLRTEVRKFTGTDKPDITAGPHTTFGSAGFPLPLPMLGLPVPHAGCGSPCGSSSQCGFFSACRYCNGLECVAGLPAEPVSDAGVDDAVTDTTTKE